MNTFIYLSVLPEALIASMLPPKEFAEYMATGTRKRTQQQAIFIEVDLDKVKNMIPMDYVNKRCVRKPDGSPKRSVYLSVYRVLEQLPLSALKNLYLVTEDGRMLELTQGKYIVENEKTELLHLYQELCPVTPVIASTLTPSQFGREMTSGKQQIQIPKLLFVELLLDQLASDPVRGAANNLPYVNIGHLRDCLITLGSDKDKFRKTVQRTFNGQLLYRTCVNGFFVVSEKEFIFYPYPEIPELEEQNYDFWRSM